MRVLDGAFTALFLGPTAVFAIDALASSVLFTTIRINTGICTPTGEGNGSNGGGNGGGNGNGGNNGGNSTSTGTVSTDYGTYDFKGYYPIPDQGSILKTTAGKTFVSSGLTLEGCGNFCAGTTYFEVQNGNQCLCGDDPPVGKPERSADPGIPCAGSHSEICGLPGFGVVYEREIGGGGLSSSASSRSPVTVIVTGVTTDTKGTHTFTSTEVVSSVQTTTVFTGVTTTVLTATSSATASDTGSGSELSTNGASSTGNGSSSSNVISSSSPVAGSSSTTSAGASSNTGGSSTGAGASSSRTIVSSSTSSVASGTSASASASSTGSVTDPCPASNGQPATIGGTTYNIACGTDYIGLPNPNDLPNTDARTFSDCIAACNNYVPSQNVANGADCVAVTFGVGGTNSCFLKYQVEEVVVNSPGYDSAIKQSFSPPNAFTISQGSTTGTSGSTGAASSADSSSTGARGSSSTVTKGSSTTVAGSSSSTVAGSSSSGAGGSSSTTMPGSSSSTAGGSSSNTVTGSSSLTLAGGSSSTVGSSSAVAGGSSSSSSITSGSDSSSSVASSSASSSSTPSSSSSSSGAVTSTNTASNTVSFGPEPTIAGQPKCPANNNTVYTDTFGYSYYVKCGVDIVGGNLYPVHADTFAKCLQYCDLINGCAAVTYLDGAASTNANCYPYSNFQSYVSGAADVYSGVPQNGTSTGYPDATGSPCAQGYNQSTFLDTFGNNYKIGCDQNINGQDIRGYVADDLDGCLTYCSLYDTCIAVDFTGFPVAQNAANCYPKSSTSNVVYQPGTQYAQYSP